MKMKKILATLLSMTMIFGSVSAFASGSAASGPSDGGNNNVSGRPPIVSVPIPTATVTQIDVEDIQDIDLTFAMNFTADEATDEQLDVYGDWYADFVLKVNKNVTLAADENEAADGYLAGQYDAWSDNWVCVPPEGTLTLAADEELKIMETAAEMMGEPGLKYTYREVYEYVRDFDCGIYLTNRFLVENPDLVVTLELRIYNNEDEEENYAIGSANEFFVTELPTATITKLNVANITEPKLTFAMNFKADEVTDEQLAFYGDWYADFVLKVNEDVTFAADENETADGYLAGQYDAWSDNWVCVPPVDTLVLDANDELKIMETAAEMMGQPGLKYTYQEVYESVQDFDCGVYFTPEYLDENPGLEVELALRIYDPESDESYLIGEGYKFEIAHDVATDENVTVKADTVDDTVIILDTKVDVTAENVEKVTIDTTAITEEKVTSVSIPKATVEAVKDIPVTGDNGTALEIKLSDNEDADKSTVVTLDNAALAAIADTTADYVTLQVKEAEEEHLEDAQVETKGNLVDNVVYKIELVDSEGNSVPFDGGKVTIKLYYPKTRNGEVHVHHLKADGTLEEIFDFTYDEATQFVTMTLEHFSEYVVYTKPIAVDDYDDSADGYVPTYTVRFDTLGAGSIANQIVYRNETATAPEAPAKEGYTFGGWYTDKAYTKEYDFATKVIKNTVLYAKWIEIEADDSTNTGDADATDWTNAFADVKADDWYYESVKYVCQNGLMTGTSEEAFSPNSKLTRAMLVTVLYRAEGSPEIAEESSFADVKDDDYFANAVVWAQKNSIVNGYSDTEFGPNKYITREQIATIMFRYAQFKGYDVSVGENTNILSYDDALEVSEYAIAAVQYTVGSSLINGKTESTLNPKDNATRAEAATILKRFIESQN